jgi:hypothetical protein
VPDVVSSVGSCAESILFTFYKQVNMLSLRLCKQNRDWRCSLAVKYLPSMCKAPVSIPSTTKKERKEKGKGEQGFLDGAKFQFC